MKKIISAVILCLLSFSIAACTRIKPVTENDFVILTSFYPVYIIAKNVAADVSGVQVKNMTPPVTGCLHDYTITGEDMRKIEQASILLINGAGMESFMQKVFEQYPAKKTASLSEGLVLIVNNNTPNPHVWVSISNAVVMTQSCARILSAADPAHAEQYNKNSQVYQKKLLVLKERMAKELAPFKGKKIVTFHEAFPYFAREYGFEIIAVVEREPGSEPSAKELAETMQLVKRLNIKALFAEPQYPASAAETIARETGSHVYTLDPAVIGPDSHDAYLEIMAKNLSVLKDALR